MIRAARRTVAVVALSGALLAGASLVPAQATPAQEAVYLAAMKQAWTGLDVSSQKTTCYAYRIAPSKLISQSVTNAMKDPVAQQALDRASWRRVIVKYLAWACSGAGTTPR